MTLFHYSPSNPTQGTSVYTIPRVTKQDEGSYICKGQSLAGDMEEILQILVLQGDPFESVTFAAAVKEGHFEGFENKTCYYCKYQ